MAIRDEIVSWPDDLRERVLKAGIEYKPTRAERVIGAAKSGIRTIRQKFSR